MKAEEGMALSCETELKSIILSVKAGEDSAFSRLLDLYAPMINKVVSGFVGQFLRYDEAFSEACVALYRSALSYDFSKSEVTFGLFARICIYRRLCDAVAKATRDTQLIDPDVDMDLIPTENTLEARLAGSERVKNYLETARTLLSDYEYRVFRLYIEGYSTAEIAEKLSRSAKSVDNAKARMFKHLYEERDKFSDI